MDLSLSQKKLNILQQPSVVRNSLNIKAEPQLVNNNRIQSDRQKFLKNNSTATVHGNVDISVVTSKSMQNKSLNNGDVQNNINSILAASDQ